MSSLNIGEYGQTLKVNLKEDISAATNLTFILEPRRGDKQTKTTNITIGAENTVVGDETYFANQYLIYTLQDGDIDEDAIIGSLIRIKGEATVGSKRVSGDYRKLRILP